MIEYKFKHLETQFAAMTDPLLVSLVEWIEGYAWDHFKKGLVITSIARVGNPDSTHCTRPVRGLDYRSRTFNEDEITELLFETNQEWIYDPGRPDKHCLIFETSDPNYPKTDPAIVIDPGVSPHCHAQVYPGFTKRRSQD